jgi:hypothetical protein
LPSIAFYPIGRAREINDKKLAYKNYQCLRLNYSAPRNIGAKFGNLRGNFGEIGKIGNFSFA